MFIHAQNCLSLAKLTISIGPFLVPGEEVMKVKTGEILALDHVAADLKVGKRTVYRLAAAKKIPAFKVSGTWQSSRADINAWIKQQSMEGLDTGREGDGVAKGQTNYPGH
jgi:excisionase family DNA binding protein